jgi:hypothetical protein
MAVKRFNKLNPNDLAAMNVKDSQDNLQEFTLMLASRTDFSTFDILSVTREDASAGYTVNTIHPKVNTQKERVASQSAQIIPWPKGTV